MRDGPGQFIQTTGKKHICYGKRLLIRKRHGNVSTAFGAPVTSNIAGTRAVLCRCVIHPEKLPDGLGLLWIIMTAKSPWNDWRKPMSACAWRWRLRTSAPGTTI